ncbi:hypothetical protein NKG94_47920 [Micromonospora sp. M12]
MGAEGGQARVDVRAGGQLPPGGSGASGHRPERPGCRADRRRPAGADDVVARLARLGGALATPAPGATPLTDQPAAVRIGEASTSDGAFPVLVPLGGGHHLALDADARDPQVAGLLRALVLRLVATAPPGQVRVAGIDTAALGATFGPLRPLLDAGCSTRRPPARPRWRHSWTPPSSTPAPRSTGSPPPGTCWWWSPPPRRRRASWPGSPRSPRRPGRRRLRPARRPPVAAARRDRAAAGGTTAVRLNQGTRTSATRPAPVQRRRQRTRRARPARRRPAARLGTRARRAPRHRHPTRRRAALHRPAARAAVGRVRRQRSAYRDRPGRRRPLTLAFDDATRTGWSVGARAPARPSSCSTSSTGWPPVTRRPSCSSTCSTSRRA